MKVILKQYALKNWHNHVIDGAKFVMRNFTQSIKFAMTCNLKFTGYHIVIRNVNDIYFEVLAELKKRLPRENLSK